MDVCLCYHNSNDTYYVRIKNDGIRPLRTYAFQLDYYTPGSMQLDGGDLTKIHTYLCEDVNGICQLPSTTDFCSRQWSFKTEQVLFWLFYRTDTILLN